jgi:hypothetical protein
MSVWEKEGQSDEWYTPKYIFNALKCRFDTDVAHPKGVSTFVPTDNFYSEDSLNKPWRGFIWMNPPFGKRNAITPWLERFRLHANGIALVPDRTSAPWFKRFASQMDVILFISPRVKFIRPDGSVGSNPANGTALFGIGKRARESLISATSLGFVVIPYQSHNSEIKHT